MEKKHRKAVARLACRRQAWLPTAAAFALSCAGAAQAGRPFETEDAGVLDRGECEWESVAARTRAPGQPPGRSLSTQLGCGTGFNTEAALAASRDRAGDERSRAWALGLKTGLPAFGRQGPAGDGGESTAFALAYGADMAPAQSPQGAGYRWNSAYATLVATRPLGAGWTGHANLGWRHDRASGRHGTTWAFAAEWAWRDSLDVGGEAHGDDQGNRWLGAGLRWAPRRSWNVSLSCATRMASPRASMASVGFTFGF